MTDFDPLHDKAYTERLTSLGEKREIVASEDIYNDQGLLLVKKGTPINKRVADKIIRFKLVKPIETSVDIENNIGAQELFEDIKSAIQNNAQATLLHQRENIDPAIKKFCTVYARYPIIRQKMTVMREQLPKLYWQSIGITWLSVLIASKMEIGEQGIEICFLAGLTHDIGMMHIDPEIINKKEALSAAEWRQIQAHTLISKKVLQNIPGIKAGVSTAVAEHHERCDGTGYPQGKGADQLSSESQILALAESAIAVTTKRLIPDGRNLRDLMPFLQVNSESHFYSTYKALILILRNADLDDKAHVNDGALANTIKKIRQQNDSLSHLLIGLQELLSQLTEFSRHKILNSANTVLTQVLRTVRGSGILDPGYLRWLDQVEKERIKHAYREVDDVSLMLDELEWHIFRIKKLLDAFIETASPEDQALVDTIQNGLANVELPQKDKLAEFNID